MATPKYVSDIIQRVLERLEKGPAGLSDEFDDELTLSLFETIKGWRLWASSWIENGALGINTRADTIVHRKLGGTGLVALLELSTLPKAVHADLQEAQALLSRPIAPGRNHEQRIAKRADKEPIYREWVEPVALKLRDALNKLERPPERPKSARSLTPAQLGVLASLLQPQCSYGLQSQARRFRRGYDVLEARDLVAVNDPEDTPEGYEPDEAQARRFEVGLTDAGIAELNKQRDRLTEEQQHALDVHNRNCSTCCTAAVERAYSGATSDQLARQAPPEIIFKAFLDRLRQTIPEHVAPLLEPLIKRFVDEHGVAIKQKIIAVQAEANTAAASVPRKS